MDISDAFIDNVLPDIMQQSGLTPPETRVERFLLVNASMRRQNNASIEETNQQSANQLLWSEPFIQLSNSQVESAFADERSYFYQNELIDEQTHLGFDLSTVAQGPVEAANEGIVVFADYLGIYGNCVMIDHGLGLMSLYAHLSRIDVETGQRIQRGELLGRTGQTGLAGGDHLHFSIYVQGVSVTPLEWWDPKWVQNHIFSRLQPTDG
jgi:murein DD-endopeptidase MepM/ murein hydrolase activator NlpD